MKLAIIGPHNIKRVRRGCLKLERRVNTARKRIGDKRWVDW